MNEETRRKAIELKANYRDLKEKCGSLEKELHRLRDEASRPNRQEQSNQNQGSDVFMSFTRMDSTETQREIDSLPSPTIYENALEAKLRKLKQLSLQEMQAEPGPVRGRSKGSFCRKETIMPSALHY